MIDVLERILYYRNQKKWSEYQLAEKSGLTQSTISSVFGKIKTPYFFLGKNLQCIRNHTF